MRYLILLQIGSFFHFTSESLCPFSSCTNVSLNLNELCEITCDPFDNHKIGNFSLNKIKFLRLKNTASMVDEIFSGLEIDELSIEAKRLGQLSANTFANITNLHELYLTNFAHLNTSHFKHLHNILQKFEIDHKKGKVNNFKVDFKIFSNFKKLKYLSIKNNFIRKIDQNLTNLTSLKSLELIGNQIEAIRIKSGFVLHLNLAQNGISLSNSDFLDLKNLKTLNVESNVIENLHNEIFYHLFSLNKLFLSKNKISKIDKNAFISLSRLSQLDLSFNRMEKIDFKIPKSLVKLSLSHNRIQKLTFEDTQLLVNLTSLDLSHNSIDHVQFCQSSNLLELDLSHNHIQVVNQTSFSGLVQLRNLYLSNNSIYHFEIQSFGQNFFLKILYLDSNNICSIPNISLLKNLNFLSLRSQRKSELRIQNYAFELLSQNEHLYIYLEENSKVFFDDKSFCSHYSNDKRLNGLHFYFDNLDGLNRCHFDQLKNSSLTIRTEASCDFVFVSNSCAPVDFDYSCDDESFLCENEMKYSTWMGFDMEIFSYLKKSQICQFRKQFLCIEIFGLKINGELGDLKSENKTISVLINIELVINVDGTQIHIQIGHIFQNGFYKYQNLFSYLGFKVEANSHFLIIKLFQAEFYFIRYYSFYGLVLKADHQFYSQAKGILVEGC